MIDIFRKRLERKRELDRIERKRQEELEKKSSAEEERNVEQEDRLLRETTAKEKLQKEIAKMRPYSGSEDEAEEEAERMKLLDTEGKIRNLINIAGEKGLVFAVNVAKKMDDPHSLDVFHDLLAKDGFYKKFLDEKGR